MENVERPAAIGLNNWIDPPGNRWAFRHVRELARTARLGRGVGSVREFVADPIDFDDVVVEHDGRKWTLDAVLAETHTDALVVIRDGVLVDERYFDGMRPDQPHLLMSVSKSLTSVLAGVFVGRGLIDPDATVPDYVAELRGTSWDGCTVEHLLAMRSGTDFDEDDYADPDAAGRIIEEISGYVPRTRDDLAPDTPTWIGALTNVRDHGGRFQYRSIITDVLAWVIESVGGSRFHELFSADLWSRIGAEHDADIIVDSAGFPCAEGGICTTARDLARFGQMVLDDGRVEIDGITEQVVPSEWFARLRHRDQGVIDAYETYRVEDSAPDECYRDMWWVTDPTTGVFSGEGINGQHLVIHHPSRSVIVKLSTWPDRMDDDAAGLTWALFPALFDRLG